MGNCCICNKDEILKQQKDEYKNKKVRINKIGNYKPYPVYYDNYDKCEILNGLNSMCDCEIHISIANAPCRIILSYIEKSAIKGNPFHIYKIIYKKINNINEITQYDIYNSIQDYIYKYKQEPKNDNNIVIIAT